MIEESEKVSVSANQSCSLRTRNRIKQHGPIFVIKERSSPVCLENREAFLLVSIKTQWIGWIPVSEIIFTQV